MNDKLDSFLKNMGALCELWTIVYKSFIAQGMNTKDAMAHTQGFMAALLSSFTSNDNKGV